MKKLLITGANGNVGKAVIEALLARQTGVQILASVRSEKAAQELPKADNLQAVLFDFDDPVSQQQALQDVGVLFLLRPPQIADVGKYFQPLITMAQQAGVAHIVFLSVQGAEKFRWIPHHRIEKLVEESGIGYTFLRPAYFMQNFTTTLRNDICSKNLIFLPAGNARFTLVDVRDVGLVAAEVIANYAAHRGKAYALTAAEALSFGQMAEILSKGLGRNIHYQSPGLFRFIQQKRKEGVALNFILVMILLHYLPRFQSQPPVTNDIERLTGKAPVDFQTFVTTHQHLLQAVQP